MEPCTSDQALVDGRFSCLENCDENHLAYGFYQYCLNYFPNDGTCYLKPYDRLDMMTCNGNFQPTDPPHWIVFIGGSNDYFMVKTMLDMLLDLPNNATYNPQLYWNATGMLESLLSCQLYSSRRITFVIQPQLSLFTHYYFRRSLQRNRAAGLCLERRPQAGARQRALVGPGMLLLPAR